MPDKVVAIAGATGFVGTAIRSRIADGYTVRGLTRSAYKMSHPDPTDPVQWTHCDAYALDSVSRALAGADVLIYLVRMADVSGIDLSQAVVAKLQKNTEVRAGREAPAASRRMRKRDGARRSGRKPNGGGAGGD